MTSGLRAALDAIGPEPVIRGAGQTLLAEHYKAQRDALLVALRERGHVTECDLRDPHTAERGCTCWISEVLRLCGDAP